MIGADRNIPTVPLPLASNCRAGVRSGDLYNALPSPRFRPFYNDFGMAPYITTPRCRQMPTKALPFTTRWWRAAALHWPTSGYTNSVALLIRPNASMILNPCADQLCQTDYYVVGDQ